MSIDQKFFGKNVSKLRFRLYNRPLHPELFEIYQDHHVFRESYEAQVWVTGCTHVIAFHRQKTSLVELMADPEAMAENLPERGLLLELPFRGERAHECKRADGINYMMNFQVEEMSPAVYTRTHHELARLGARRGLFVPFPRWMTRGLTPFSFIDYDARANELHVFAFHAFPEDLTMIRTQSIFELG